MNLKIVTAAAALFALTNWAPGAIAQDSDESSNNSGDLRNLSREERRAAIEAMTDDERAALRESSRERRDQRRADRESMTPEQREVAQRERRERFESLSPEQQEAMRDRRGQRKQSGDRSSRRGQGSSRQGQGRRGNRPTGGEHSSSSTEQ